MPPVNDISIRELLQLMLGEHDDRERVRYLRGLGLSRKLISEMTGRSQSFVSRLLDQSVYSQHLKYNRDWKRARKFSSPSATTNTGEEPSGSDALYH